MDERLRFVARLLEGEKMTPPKHSGVRSATANSCDHRRQVALYKGPTRTRLQILLEADRCSFGWKLHRDHE